LTRSRNFNLYCHQTFRFRTRLQRLNSLEAAGRAKINFLQQLQMFHSQQGNPNVSIPIIDRQPLDVWALRKAVQSIGPADWVS
jgi:histone demethylase JARID1